jgi:hypothetical protein
MVEAIRHFCTVKAVIFNKINVGLKRKRGKGNEEGRGKNVLVPLQHLKLTRSLAQEDSRE